MKYVYLVFASKVLIDVFITEDKAEQCCKEYNKIWMYHKIPELRSIAMVSKHKVR
jgi:hypothetical protein